MEKGNPDLFDQDEINNWIDELCVEPKPLSIGEKVKAGTYAARLTLGQKFARVTAPIWGVVIVLGMLSVFVGAAVADSSCSGYKVKPGDTLWEIAMERNIEMSWITDNNNEIVNPDLIFVGQCLKIPSEGRTYNAIPNAYVRAESDIGHELSGTRVLAEVLQMMYPEYGRSVDPTYGIGTYASRNARGSNSLSTHATGRAFDMYFGVCSDKAEDVARLVVENAEMLGVQRVLACSLGWNSDGGWFTPSERLQEMHDGTGGYPAHLHVELSPEGASNLTDAQAWAVLAPVVESPLTTIPIDENQLPVFIGDAQSQNS